MVSIESTKEQTKTKKKMMMKMRKEMMCGRKQSSCSTSVFNVIVTFLFFSIVSSLLLLISTSTFQSQPPATSTTTTSLLDISYVYGFSVTSSLPTSSSASPSLSSSSQAQNQKNTGTDVVIGPSKTLEESQPTHSYSSTNDIKGKEGSNNEKSGRRQDLEQSFLSYITFVDNDNDNDDGNNADDSNNGDDDRTDHGNNDYVRSARNDYDSNAWPSIRRFSFEEEGGKQSKEISSTTRRRTESKAATTETTLLLDEHIHRAYRDWCYYYNKPSNPKGLAAFKCNFQAVQEFHVRTGQPLLMNEYADLTELEFKQLTLTKRSNMNQHHGATVQRPGHLQKFHPKFSEMKCGRGNVDKFAVFENTLSGDFNPYTGSSSSPSASSSPHTSQPRSMSNPWLSPPPPPLSEPRVSPPPPRRRRRMQRTHTNGSSKATTRTRSKTRLEYLHTYDDNDNDIRLQPPNNPPETRHKVQNIERPFLEMVDVNIQNSRMIESLASNQMMMVEMISSLQQDMIQLQRDLEESRRENQILKDRLNMTSPSIVEPKTVTTHNRTQAQPNGPGGIETIAPTGTMQPTSSETVATNDGIDDPEHRPSSTPSSESNCHPQSAKILISSTKSRVTNTVSDSRSIVNTTTPTPENNTTTKIAKGISSSLLSLNPIDVMYKPHADGFTRCGLKSDLGDGNSDGHN